MKRRNKKKHQSASPVVDPVTKVTEETSQEVQESPIDTVDKMMLTEEQIDYQVHDDPVGEYFGLNDAERAATEQSSADDHQSDEELSSRYRSIFSAIICVIAIIVGIASCAYCLHASSKVKDAEAKLQVVQEALDNVQQADLNLGILGDYDSDIFRSQLIRLTDAAGIEHLMYCSHITIRANSYEESTNWFVSSKVNNEVPSYSKAGESIFYKIFQTGWQDEDLEVASLQYLKIGDSFITIERIFKEVPSEYVDNAVDFVNRQCHLDVSVYGLDLLPRLTPNDISELNFDNEAILDSPWAVKAACCACPNCCCDECTCEP